MPTDMALRFFIVTIENPLSRFVIEHVRYRS